MKCPICGEDFIWNINSKSCPNNHNCEDFIKKIERLKKRCSETGINVLHDKMVEVVQYVSEKLNPETIVYKDLSIILEFED